MNQILMVEDKKKTKKSKKSSGPIEIKNIIRFFAIIIIMLSIEMPEEIVQKIYPKLIYLGKMILY